MSIKYPPYKKVEFHVTLNLYAHGNFYKTITIIFNSLFKSVITTSVIKILRFDYKTQIVDIFAYSTLSLLA